MNNEETSEPQDQKETHRSKYRKTIENYHETLYRSTFAIKKELVPALEELTKASGAKSFSELVGALASNAQKVGPMLQPFVESFKGERERARRKGSPVQLLKEAREGGLSSDEIAAALQAAVLAKKDAQ